MIIINGVWWVRQKGLEFAQDSMQVLRQKGEAIFKNSKQFAQNSIQMVARTIKSILSSPHRSFRILLIKGRSIPYDILLHIFQSLPARLIGKLRLLNREIRQRTTEEVFLGRHKNHPPVFFVLHRSPVLESSIMTFSLHSFETSSKEISKIQIPTATSAIRFRIVNSSGAVICLVGLSKRTSILLLKPLTTELLEFYRSTGEPQHKNLVVGFGSTGDDLITIKFDFNNQHNTSNIQLVDHHCRSRGSWVTLQSKLSKRVTYVESETVAEIDGNVLWFCTCSCVGKKRPVRKLLSFSLVTKNFTELELPQKELEIYSTIGRHGNSPCIATISPNTFRFWVLEKGIWLKFHSLEFSEYVRFGAPTICSDRQFVFWWRNHGPVKVDILTGKKSHFNIREGSPHKLEICETKETLLPLSRLQ